MGRDQRHIPEKRRKQANEDLCYQEQNHSSRLRPVERRFQELGIWGSDQLIEKRGRKLEV